MKGARFARARRLNSAAFGFGPISDRASSRVWRFWRMQLRNKFARRRSYMGRTIADYIRESIKGSRGSGDLVETGGAQVQLIYFDGAGGVSERAGPVASAQPTGIEPAGGRACFFCKQRRGGQSRTSTPHNRPKKGCGRVDIVARCPWRPPAISFGSPPSPFRPIDRDASDVYFSAKFEFSKRWGYLPPHLPSCRGKSLIASSDRARGVRASRGGGDDEVPPPLPDEHRMPGVAPSLLRSLICHAPYAAPAADQVTSMR